MVNRLFILPTQRTAESGEESAVFLSLTSLLIRAAVRDPARARSDVHVHRLQRCRGTSGHFLGRTRFVCGCVPGQRAHLRGVFLMCVSFGPRTFWPPAPAWSTGPFGGTAPPASHPGLPSGADPVRFERLALNSTRFLCLLEQKRCQRQNQSGETNRL